LSEEAHAIEAAIEGQGVALVSDFMVARELKHGLLEPASQLTLQGLTFYAAYSARAPRRQLLERVVDYLAVALNTPP